MKVHRLHHGILFLSTYIPLNNVRIQRKVLIDCCVLILPSCKTATCTHSNVPADASACTLLHHELHNSAITYILKRIGSKCNLLIILLTSAAP